jgi:hypothetical protein
MNAELALPDPQTIAVAQVPGLVARVTEMREVLRGSGDISAADELRRRMNAYVRYIADKKSRLTLEAETRRTEVLVGELLGPAVVGANQHSGGLRTSKGLNEWERSVFRDMAEYVDLVEAQVAGGVTKRDKILVAIKRAELAKAGQVVDIGDSIRTGDFRTVLADIPDSSVDLIFTDPPYDKGCIEIYGEIAEFGARVLKPGGSLLAYCGQYALPQILVDMDQTLRYWWLCACVHDGGNHKSLSGVQAYVLWKPIVWFVKETNGATEFVYDAILRPAPDKNAHDWQQALAEPLHYIEKLTPPNGLVVDPCVGGGTTALAARELKRRFIGAELNATVADQARGRVAA